MKKTAALLSALIMLCFTTGSAPRPMTDSVPEITLKNLNGEDTPLSVYRGKVLLLNFWATWCPPCREEIPDLIALREKYAARGLEVVGISLDDEGAETVKPFAEAEKIPYPILIGNEQVARTFGGIRGVPTTFIVNREGKILRKLVGTRSKSFFENEVLKVL